LTQVASPSESPETWGGSLTRRLLKASGWAVASNVGNQGIRFASNLVLSRLLFPEAFGVMALVTAVLAGLDMFTDLGLGPSVIRTPNPTRRFLDAAWSLQVVRGVVVCVVAALLAYPMARWYHEYRLIQFVPVAALTSAIRGLSHLTPLTFNRDLKFRQLFILDIGSQLAGVIVSAVGAWISASIWALVIGNVAGAIARTVLSYTMSDEPRPHWCWDKQELKAISSFGRWVLFSTVLSYLISQGDRLILGSFVSLKDVALYSIATVIIGAIFRFNTLLAERVLFPLYAKIGRETTPQFVRRVAKVRMATMGAILPLLCAFVCFGDLVVRLFWDSRYHAAGQLVRVLAGGSIFLTFGAGPLYLVRGEAWAGVLFGAVQSVFTLPAMAIGAHYYGLNGFVWGLALSQSVDYALEAWIQRRYKVWLPWLDALAYTGAIVLIGLGLLLRRALNL
jgi:O-antigen/teichoic acid export membrane protein